MRLLHVLGRSRRRRRRALSARRADGHGRSTDERRAANRDRLLAEKRVPRGPLRRRAELPRGAGACSAARRAAGERADRFYGIGDLPFYYRKPFGPGWALVGDAGYHKDPITAQGISDAFRDSDLLADALDAGFTGTRPLDEALADYERARNEATRGLYELTYEFASLAPPAPEQQALFGALRANSEDTNRFFGVVAGTVRPDEFFAPENIGRIVGAPVPA